MAHHLTPSELAEQLQMNQQEVIGKCVEMGVPILHGRIDKTLFETSLDTSSPRREPQPAPRIDVN
jgi:hypothetical protein